MENSNKGKLIAALLTGAAIGGALGILFAPGKGSETRKRISSKSNKLTDAVKEKFGAVTKKFKKDASSDKEKTNKLEDNGRPVMENTLTGT